jgi:hypothetical protein
LSGFQEILVIVAILLAIIFMPRLMHPQQAKGSVVARVQKAGRAVSGRLRLAVFISLLWIVGAAVYSWAWQGTWPPFVIGGLIPVALFWGMAWVVKGFTRDRRLP